MRIALPLENYRRIECSATATITTKEKKNNKLEKISTQQLAPCLPTPEAELCPAQVC